MHRYSFRVCCDASATLRGPGLRPMQALLTVAVCRGERGERGVELRLVVYDQFYIMGGGA